jgi:hypothetical protein
MAESLAQCERDVEQARSKLAQDLATLRSPATFSSFTDSLKHEALDAKDSLVEQAGDAVHNKLNEFVQDLKAKAAANPAAALTIGAGIVWQLIRNPPIATALVGAGLFSLWRTHAFPAHRSDREYLEQGKERLKEQVTGFGSSAMAAASGAGRAVSAKTGEIVDTAKDKIQDWSRDAADSAAAAGSTVKAQADSAVSAARRTMHDIADEAGQVRARATTATNGMVHDTMASGGELLGKVGRDNVLLGVAGLAVAAALGMAYQKRVSEEVE